MLSLYSAVMPILQPSVSTRYTIHLITSPRALRSLLAASGTSRLNVYVLDVRARNFRRPANVIYSLHDVVSAGVCVGCVFGNCIWALSGMMIGFFVGMPCRYRGSSRPACINCPLERHSSAITWSFPHAEQIHHPVFILIFPSMRDPRT